MAKTFNISLLFGYTTVDDTTVDDGTMERYSEIDCIVSKNDVEYSVEVERRLVWKPSSISINLFIYRFRLVIII